MVKFCFNKYCFCSFIRYLIGYEIFCEYCFIVVWVDFVFFKLYFDGSNSFLRWCYKFCQVGQGKVIFVFRRFWIGDFLEVMFQLF